MAATQENLIDFPGNAVQMFNNAVRRCEVIEQFIRKFRIQRPSGKSGRIDIAPIEIERPWNPGRKGSAMNISCSGFLESKLSNFDQVPIFLYVS